MNDSLQFYLKWMQLAMNEAEIALQENEVPVGAIFVKHKIINQSKDRTEKTIDKDNISQLLDLQHGEIIARDHNRTNKTRDVRIF
jgi:tRNA(Arg) A34 adenosine deaminase TadA